MSLIGIDLDDVLITSSHRGIWKFKRDAIKYLLLLQNQGYQFHIITARVPSYENNKYIQKGVDSLVDHHIVVQDITYTSYSPKGKFASILGCKYMIDDYEEYLSDCADNNVIPVLLVPGKKHQQITGYKTVCSWAEIYEFLHEQSQS